MQNRWIHGFVAVLCTVSTACQNNAEPGQSKPETVTQSAKPASDTAMAPKQEATPAAPAKPAAAPGTAAAEATPGQPAPGTTAPAAEGSAQASELKPGDPVPAATLTLQNGKTVDLKSLNGKQVVLYFYPKDDTPGCTVEAQGIRDQWAAFEKAGIQVYGVSRQDAASHSAFIEKHKLPFDLVVDDGSVTKAFGVPVSGGEYAARHTFLIGTDGKIKQVWRSVNPSEHAKELLEAAGASPEAPATKAG